MHVSSPNLITSFAIFSRIDSHLNDSEDYEKLTCYDAKRTGAKDRRINKWRTPDRTPHAPREVQPHAEREEYDSY